MWSGRASGVAMSDTSPAMSLTLNLVEWSDKLYNLSEGILEFSEFFSTYYSEIAPELGDIDKGFLEYYVTLFPKLTVLQYYSKTLFAQSTSNYMHTLACDNDREIQYVFDKDIMPFVELCGVVRDLIFGDAGYLPNGKRLHLCRKIDRALELCDDVVEIVTEKRAVQLPSWYSGPSRYPGKRRDSDAECERVEASKVV